jgi:hypothetical protein
MNQPVTIDPQEDQQRLLLENEQRHILEFLSSDGYKTAHALNERIYDDAIKVLLEYEINGLQDFVVLLEARTEARVLKQFHNRFLERLQEIGEELGETKPETSKSNEHSDNYTSEF